MSSAFGAIFSGSCVGVLSPPGRLSRDFQGFQALEIFLARHSPIARRVANVPANQRNMCCDSFTNGNGTIGSATGAMWGTYNEFGVWGDFQW